jgi:hypothetical protein
MDIQTIDQQYQQLQTQAQGTAQELSSLADKLQAAAQGGNQDAREWLLDLKSIALAFRAEQTQVGLLLQALHGFVANQASAMQAPPAPAGWTQPPPADWNQAPNQPPPGWNQAPNQPPPGWQPGYGQPQQQGGVGGMLGSFLNSGFGRAIEMGAGFGIGDELIKKIF